MSSTIVTVPKDSTFKLPEGRFKAIITQYKVKEINKSSGSSQIATILFEVFVPGQERYECLARKIVPVDLRPGSAMRKMIESLLGPDFFKGKSDQPIDMRALLVGRACEVVLVHAKHDDDRYDWPLVDVECVYLGAGSAEWSNWSRAIIALNKTDVDNLYELIAAKRGARLKWRTADGESLTMKRYIGHSKRPDTICWVEMAIADSQGHYVIPIKEQPKKEL